MLKFAEKIRNQSNSINYPVKSDRGNFEVHHRVRADFSYSGLTFNRTFGARQRFTYVGDVSPIMMTGTSSLAGVNKKYLTLEGAVNMDAVLNDVRMNTGATAQAVHAHGYNVANWSWEDNHTTLLVNLLRLYHLKKLEEDGLIGKGELPEYNDGHVRIANFGDVTSLDTFKLNWPCGKNAEGYPEWALFNEVLPSIDVPYIDLRGNSVAEAEIILMMTAAWSRTSNLIIDYNLPRLCERLAYRANHPIGKPDEWIEAGMKDEDFPVPPSKLIWNAYRKYVSHNRLFNQAFTATYILSQMMVRPFSNSAEGMIWTKATPVLALPTFKSARGRYPFLLTGEAALIQASALSDWNSIGNSPDSINTVATVLASAINIGLYARSFKAVVDGAVIDDSYDLSLFIRPETFVASALANATGFDAPLNGSDGCYIYYDQFVDVTQINSIEATVFEGDGYDYTPAEGLKVIGTPLATNPYLIYPLATFDSANPFSGSFHIKAPHDFVRNGARVSKYEAWCMSWALRVAGYDVECKFSNDETGLSKFYAANEDSWTAIPYAALDDDVLTVILKSQEMRRNHFVDIPNLTRPGFGQDIDVKINLIDSYHEAKKGDRTRNHTIGAYTSLPKTAGIQVISGNDLMRTWGAVRRTKEGLTMSDTIRPAIVPDVTESTGNIDLSGAGNDA
uniref:Major coat protein L-A virus domain-containing protein n=1 Tax=Ambrosiozyma totivirus A TaxID=2593997 RepID=A0A7G3KHA0_9VIRU|nr:unknown [Ambrosiozyma totivirus A]